MHKELKRAWRVAGLLLVLMLVLAGPVLAAGTPTIDWWVMAGGGGNAQSGKYTLDGTVGQGITFLDLTPTPHPCAGFWCALVGWYRYYLPLDMKNAS